MNQTSILLAGETWVTSETHVKGFATYGFGGFGNGAAPLVTALCAEGFAVTHIPNHLATNDFPFSLESLSQYQVVALSDIGADTLLLHPDTFVRSQRMPDRLQLIADFVSAGGGLIMIGGWMSFSGVSGQAHFQCTALADLLPVEMLGYDDRVETPAGVTPRVDAPGHPVLEGVPGDWPFFLGYNRFTPKAEAQVVMSVGADPFLVLSTRGSGRVAAFASDCSPHWGTPEFLDWSGYRRFWANIMSWLANTTAS